jgi:hypothetical protein
LFVNLPSSFLLTRPVLSGDQGIASLKRVAAGEKKVILLPFFLWGLPGWGAITSIIPSAWHCNPVLHGMILS